MKIKELRERQARLVTEARERLDQLTPDVDEARAAELESQHDLAMAEHDRLERQIQREEKQHKLEQKLEESRARNRPYQSDEEEPGVSNPDEKVTYRSAFHRMILAGGELSDLSPEERSVLRGGIVNVKEQRAQLTTTNAAGGYTVPTELADQIIKTMKDWGPMYDEGICTVLNTASGNPIKLPTIDDTSGAAAVKAEGVAIADTGAKDVEFGQRSLDAFVYDTEFIRFSMELAQDSIFNMEALLGSLLGERLARIANKELTIGTGVSQPNGIVVASKLGKTTVADNAFTSDEIIDLLHSVNSAYRRSPKARFMFSDLTLAAIRKLKDGQGNYLWQMGDVTKNQPGTLLGYQYSINDDMDAIGAGNKPIIFGDLSKYFVRKVGSPLIGVLKERFWPDLGIAGLIRFDGELGDSDAVKHLLIKA